jgi:3-oxoacyl-[acyl-carrier-protein] synthase III
MPNSIITATGSYTPPRKITNDYFLNHDFYDADGIKVEKTNTEIVNKLLEITGIKERRYVSDDQTTSDIASMAAEKAIKNIDRETLDYIIVAQNMGDVKADNNRVDIVPTIASRVKHKLGIENPYTVCFDLPFGCPGWLQGAITANYFIRSGDAKRILVIGAETLSRVADPHDIDSMIYADGAGATLIEATDQNSGILCHVTRSDTSKEAYFLRMGPSYNPNRNGNDLFVKMDGHLIYKYAVRTVPVVIQKNLENAGLDIRDVNKILIHQANEKMDMAIVKRLFRLYNIDKIDPDIMPMIICWSGNSSVATLPMLLDFINRGKLENHQLNPGDIIVFASVGAGMNINSMIYRMPH